MNERFSHWNDEKYLMLALYEFYESCTDEQLYLYSDAPALP